jgi:hypothetical protein
VHWAYDEQMKATSHSPVNAGEFLAWVSEGSLNLDPPGLDLMISEFFS